MAGASLLTVYGRTVPARLCAKAVTVVEFKGAEETMPANRIPENHTTETVQIIAHAEKMGGSRQSPH